MKNIRGFTLIELLVVISIIGFLATLAMVSLGDVRKKARDARVKSDKTAIIKALKMYYDQNGSFPDSGGWKCLGISSTQRCWLSSYTGLDALNTQLNSFLPKIPLPPTGSSSCRAYNGYLYNRISANQVTLIWNKESGSFTTNSSECPGNAYPPTTWSPADPCGYYCYENITF